MDAKGRDALDRRSMEAEPCVWQRFVAAFEYPVYFTRHVLDPANPVLERAIARDDASAELDAPHRVLDRPQRVLDRPQRIPDCPQRVWALVDAGVEGAARRVSADFRRYVSASRWLEEIAAPLVLPGGEDIKNDPTLPAQLHEQIHRHGIDRHSTIVAIGGGALLDAVGFAAATAHRGIRLARLPTTVLAQNDAGIGVKNGINLRGAKNFVGTFAPPYAVINDLEWIRSLPLRDRRAGIAEAIKVALIKDSQFFGWIERRAAELRSGDPDALERLIRRTAELHLEHIRMSGDPFEQGSARPLDFGHWAAHRLERLSSHALRHGEAVAIGLALDTLYSAEVGLLDPASASRVCAVIDAVGLPTWSAHLGLRDTGGDLAVFAGIEEFREHLGGRLTVTLLAGIGKGVEVNDLQRELILRALRRLEVRQPRA